MGYDRALAERIRDHLAPTVIAEKAMFGGLGFMVNGNMAVAALSTGGFMVRVAPEEAPGWYGHRARAMVMRGRAMSGWLQVDADDLADEDMARFIRLGVDTAHSLPAKD